MPSKVPKSRTLLRQMTVMRRVHPAKIQMLIHAVRPPPKDTPFEFITQTLKPFMYADPAFVQFKKSYSLIQSVLNYLAYDYCLVAEITKEGNVHFHAWVIFTEGKDYSMYADCIKQCGVFGFSCLSKKNSDKPISDQRRDAYDYLTKDLERSYKFIRHLDLVHNRTEEIIEENEIRFDTSELDNIIN